MSISVRMAIGAIDVAMMAECEGYSPDVADDVKARCVEAVHELVHIQQCGLGSDGVVFDGERWESHGGC